MVSAEWFANRLVQLSRSNPAQWDCRRAPARSAASAMQDMLAHLEKLRAQIADCERLQGGGKE